MQYNREQTIYKYILSSLLSYIIVSVLTAYCNISYPCLRHTCPYNAIYNVTVSPACVNITYISEDIGVRLSFSINGYIYISREISLRNPPPYCLSLPFLKEYASICLRLRNLKLRKRNLDGCLELDAELYHVHVATIHLGCFTIPI
ncbi:unnamed protein product [Brugia pahangi]|uniref:DUF4773 domain-containing protein n=1 Tax=Brugia pahangi TaxID=6280 RepID=A0A0N4U082_BRUPA|nr:unnamed protein product [Brugia pahangi]